MPKSLVKNHFETAGIYVNGERSKFRFNKPIHDSFMAGMLVPLGDPIPVFPGKKFSLAADLVVRSNTMIVPPLDGMYLDVVSVWVPHRIVWNHMPQFLGEPESTAWTQTSSYVYPYVTLTSILGFTGLFYSAQTGGYISSSIQESVLMGNFALFPHYGLMADFSDYSMLASSVASLHINVLAARGYYACWNYLFRDENYQRPVLFSKGDTGSAGEFGYIIRDFVCDSSNNKFGAAMTSAGITLGGANSALLMPVNRLHDAFTSVLPQAQFGAGQSLPLGTTAPVYYEKSGATLTSGTPFDFYVVGKGNSKSDVFNNVSSASGGSLVADLTNATAASINQLRTSVMYQRYIEALARGGRRMVEYYSTIYQVKDSAARCDYPELLSRSRYMLGVNQVVATADSSGSGWTSHLGDTGAYSLTALKNVPICQKDFTEFGYLHILYCVRSDNRWSNIIQPHFLRSDILSEYNPYFDHIGDVELKNYVVNFNTGTPGNFGFQEAWWDERTQLAMSNCALNKKYGSLKYWILGEAFGSTLTACTPEFLTFNPKILDDVFVSAHYAYPQFIMDARIHGITVARMSQHSTPGIVGRI